MKTLTARELANFYKNHMNVEILEIDGQAYACDANHWNGERYNDCWQMDENYKVLNECSIASELQEIAENDVPAEIKTELEEDGDSSSDGETFFLFQDGKYFKSVYVVC